MAYGLEKQNAAASRRKHNFHLARLRLDGLEQFYSAAHCFIRQSFDIFPREKFYAVPSGEIETVGFPLAVLFGANMSYATPMAYKTNLLVMSAGNYRFSDFVKVGTPLTIIMWLVLTYVLAAIYL